MRDSPTHRGTSGLRGHALRFANAAEKSSLMAHGAAHVAFALPLEYPPGQMPDRAGGFKKQDRLDLAA